MWISGWTKAVPSSQTTAAPLTRVVGGHVVNEMMYEDMFMLCFLMFFVFWHISINYICSRHMFIISSHYFVEPGSDKSGFWILDCFMDPYAIVLMSLLSSRRRWSYWQWSCLCWCCGWFQSWGWWIAGGSRGLQMMMLMMASKVKSLVLTYTDYTDSDAHGRPFRYCCETRLHKAGLDSEHGMPATYRTRVALNSTSNHNARLCMYMFFLYIWDHLSCLMKWLAKDPRFWSCDKSKPKWVQVGIVRNLECIATDSELSQWLSNRVPALLFSGFLPHISS